MDKVSDGPSEIASVTSDSSAVNSAAVAGSNETSRRGRRNRRDRHKNSNKATLDSVAQPTHADPTGQLVSQPAVSLADSQWSARNKSSVIGSSSSVSLTGGREATKAGSMDAVKLSSLSVSAPPSSSITGNDWCFLCCRKT